MPATGPERIRRREGQDAAGTDAIGAGRLRDQAKRAVAADGLPLADEGGSAEMRRRCEASEGRFGEAEPEGCASIRAEWRRAENRRAPVPTVAKNAPASRAAPCRGGGSLSGRTRRQSRDCRAVRDATRGAPLRGGKRGWRVLRHTMTGTARTAQSSLAQTDRQQFQRHGKSLRPFRTMPKMLLSQCFQGVRRIFGIIYPGFSGTRVDKRGIAIPRRFVV